MRALLPLALLAGCAQPGCGPGGVTSIEAKLLMGAPRDPAAFTDFLDRNVTPRFPDGLTVLDATGRWRAPDGRMLRETSKVVLIVAPDGPDTLPRLQSIRDEYRARFNQQSVGLTVARVCAAF